MPKKYWLMKTEPSTYSIHDLQQEPNQTTSWDGVRNYQARNFMRDEMKLGDEVLLYHSNADPPAVVGTATVVRESYPDHTAWDPNDVHFDPKTTADNPRWFMVDIQYIADIDPPVTRDELKMHSVLSKMGVMKKGNRLSVLPVAAAEWRAVLDLRDMADPLVP